MMSISFTLKPLTIATKSALGLLILLPCVAIAEDNVTDEALPTTTLEKIVVIASPFQTEAGEMATATSIKYAYQLEQQTASTLGDVLADEAGVSTDSFAQGASRPIIRGQTAPRVKVMNNGLTVHDASQISPDHQVAVPVFGAKQIEVIKGTSALMYGGGAVGGVVNVVDNALQPQLQPKITGKVVAVGQQATDGYLGYAELMGGLGDNWVWQTSLQRTDQGNIQVPHWDSTEINNSWYKQDNANVGVSYVKEDGYIGLSYQQLTSEYGLPFHVHNHCEISSTDSDKLACASHAPHVHEEQPYVKLKSDVYQLFAEKQMPMMGVDKITGKISYTDYHHDEIDEGKVGTTFDNRAINARIDATHATFRTGTLGFIQGIVGLDFNQSKFSSQGIEGYLPTTKRNQIGVYLIERLTPTYRGASVSADKFSAQLPDDGHDHAEHQHDLTPTKPSTAPEDKDPWYAEFGVRQEFQTINDISNDQKVSHAGTSVSIEGGKYINPNNQLALRISHSERLPASQELFANGSHLATNAWERGNTQLKREKTNGVELTYRYDNQKKFETSISGFYNDIQNYTYDKTTDLITSGEEKGFRLIDYTQTKAKHYGGEITSRYKINQKISVGGFADIAIIKLDDSQSKYAPRLTAPRIGGDISAVLGQFDLTLSGYHRFEQDKIANFETVTPSYNMLDAKVVYNSKGKHIYKAFFQVKNILNELAYNHASYLVDYVPLPERSINVGITYQF